MHTHHAFGRDLGCSCSDPEGTMPACISLAVTCMQQVYNALYMYVRHLLCIYVGQHKTIWAVTIRLANVAL